MLEAGLDRFGWAGFPARREEAASRGKLLGRGLSYYLEATGGAESERAEIRFADDGFVDVYVGTQSTGQGHETAYVQLTADRLGVDGDRIRIRQGDTDTIPVGGGTGGARSLYSEGQAILATAATVIEKGKRAAAETLEAAPADITFEAGRFSIVGTDRGIDIVTLAVEQHRRSAKAGRARSSTRPRSPLLTRTRSRTAAISPRSRSIRRPDGQAWCATSCATMSAGRSTR